MTALTPEMKRYIRDEISRSINIVLTGQVDTADKDVSSVAEIFPNMPAQDGLLVAHPFGFVSRAPVKTFAVTVRVGEHIGNRMVILHRDANRPDLNQGDAVLYSSNPLLGSVRRQIRLGSDIKIGSDSSAEPVVLGNVLKAFITDLITTLQSTPIGLTTSPGNPIAPNPAFVTATNALKLQYVTTPTTNIVSTIAFSERGAPAI